MFSVIFNLSVMKIINEIFEFLSSNNIFVRKYDHVDGMTDYIRVTMGTKEMMMRVTEKIDQFLSLKLN